MGSQYLQFCQLFVERLRSGSSVLCSTCSNQQNSALSPISLIACGVFVSGIVFTAAPTIAFGQSDELQQLDDFLSPPPTESPQFQPTVPTRSLPTDSTPSPSSSPAISPAPAVIAPPPPFPRQPQLNQPQLNQPQLNQPQLTLLSLNSHSPGTLGNPRQLHDGYYQDLFQFEGQLGELILLNLIGSDDPRMQLDPRLQLIGPDGSIVAEDDNGGYDSARGDARIVLELPDTGSYTIVVTTAEPEDRGRYTLGLLEVDDPSAIQ